MPMAAGKEGHPYGAMVDANFSMPSVYKPQTLNDDEQKDLLAAPRQPCVGGMVNWFKTRSFYLFLGMVVTAIVYFFFPLSKPGLSLNGLILPESTVDITLDIANKEIQPDGFSRTAVLAGGTFPGTPILATKGPMGTMFKINVTDNLTNRSMERSTSIHWHGIFQHGTNWADGTSSVTQCPITPGHSFQYEFIVPSQVGTYWYHSHFSTQYCDGLRGAFVIYDPDDPYKNDYDFDDANTIITLSDWYHELSTVFRSRPVESSATLINGIGRYKNGPTIPWAVINVQEGRRYRFRIIAMACDKSFIFSIDHHNLTIIEADGEYTDKLEVDSINIHAAQRYSVIMSANQPVGNYWIRANYTTKTAGFEDSSAILRYAGAQINDPTTNATRENPFKEVDLHAKFNPTPPGKPCVGCADVNLNLVQSFNKTKLLYEINGKTFLPPTVPVLLQILNGFGNDLVPAGSIYPLPANKTIEVTIPGLDKGGPHPYHLHGHSFWVVRSANSSVYNWENPVRRDTVDTGLADSNMTFRFVTDNAGPWFLHCHIDWHLEAGLAVVFAEDIAGTERQNPPISWKRLCPIYDTDPPE